MPPAGFKAAIPTNDCPQTHTSDRAFIGIVWVTICVQLVAILWVGNYCNRSYHISDEQQTLRQ